MTAEQERLDLSADPQSPWRTWGPYVSARQWGTVREDYSAGGDAWDFFPFDHAHRRAYRWGEDGLAGLCDLDGFLNVGVAFWNGADDRLKERLFGLSGPQGNHGEDVKEYWWPIEGTPTHSYAKWLYRYPQAAFPYADLVAGNAARGLHDDEFELTDTGVLEEDRFFDIEVTHAKASPSDICIDITATNHGPEAAPLHLVPQIWFRNTWAWGRDERRPHLGLGDAGEAQAVIVAEHHELGTMHLIAHDHPQAGAPKVIFCDNDSNATGLWGPGAAEGQLSAYPKDVVNDVVVHGREGGNPDNEGTKAGLQWVFDAVAPGESVTVKLRLIDSAGAPASPQDHESVTADRIRDTEEFYAEVIPEGTSDEDAHIARRAFAGLQWGKQLYLYNVSQWLEGDPASPPPPRERAQRPGGRNTDWSHVDMSEVISMPDEWEYPWFATWDLGFHCVALAHVDPAWAKWQLLLMTREWSMHPNGQLPAYEWNFSDVNPPVHPWAAWQIYALDGGADREFLQRIVLKMLLNFPWWVNRKDANGSHVFEGGFLGLDNVGLFDRSEPLPDGQRLEQADATAWMGMFALKMLRMSAELAREDSSWDEVATKFLTHFLAISEAMEDFGTGDTSLWGTEDGFFHDVLVKADGSAERLPVRSMVGLLPMMGVAMLPDWIASDLPEFTDFVQGWITRRPELANSLLHIDHQGQSLRTLSMISHDQWDALLAALLDEQEFLSPHGIRSLSAIHREGVSAEIEGKVLGLKYQPAESRSYLFGGNSNWRGPIWMPVNALVTDAMRIYGRGAGVAKQVAVPTGSDDMLSLCDAATAIEQRLVGLFRPGADGRRPSTPIHHPSGPLWDVHPTFSEYFNGDNGTGLGASHQTGWTALVAHFICAPDGVFQP